MILKKKLLLATSLLFSLSLHAQKTQCGGTDDREISTHPAIGRMLKSMESLSGCTGTMISNHCMISAGHCYDYAQLVEFNTPLSKLGKLVHPPVEDIYSLDRVIDYSRRGIGDDWMVFKLKKNAVTGEIPGIKQGILPLSLSTPKLPFMVEIIGYGADKRLNRNFAQQRATGFLTELESMSLRHTVDTQGGNSGSAVLEIHSQSILGVHTHGGCSPTDDTGANAGTFLHENANFQAAIEQCLSEEQDQVK